MDSLRILLVAQFYPPDVGGEERHVHGLANELARRGHRVAVATQTLTGEPTVTDEDGVRVHRVRSTMMRLPVHSSTGRPHAPPFADPGLRARLGEVVRAERPQVVHGHNWAYYSALAPARQAGAPLLLTLHDYGHVCPTHRLMRPDGSLCAGPELRACLSCAAAHYGPAKGFPVTVAHRLSRPGRDRGLAHIFAVSNAVAEHNRLAQGAVPWSVLPNFVPARLLSDVDGSVAGPRDPELPAGDFLLFVGELHEQKGVGTLLDAYRRIPAAVRPPLVCLGRPGPAPFDLPEGVRVLGPWPHERVMGAVRACTIAVVPSRWPDPCPTTVLEAMAAGRPLVATRTGGIPDMVADGETGLLVEPDDPAGLARALTTLLADPDRARSLGRAGRRRVTAFTDRAVVDRLTDVYRAVA
jgi:glycosyltransferase involved in cell wall biosynthesis